MDIENKKRIMISELYPGLTSEEQIEVEANLLRYLGVVKRIFEQLSEQKPEILTEIRKRVRLRKSGKSA